jgi:hypothetical protein
MSTSTIKQISRVSSTISPRTICLPFSPVIGSLRYEPGCEGSPIPQSRAAAFFHQPKRSRVLNSPIGSRRNHSTTPIAAASPASKQKASVGLGIDLLRLAPVHGSVISASSVEPDEWDSISISVSNSFPISPFDFSVPVKSTASFFSYQTLVGLGFGPELSFEDKVSTITQSPTILFSPHPSMLPCAWNVAGFFSYCLVYRLLQLNHTLDRIFTGT